MHADGGQAGHVIGRAYILRVHQTVWAVKERVQKLERGRIIVHLFQEILNVVGMEVELIGADSRLIALIVTLLVVVKAAEILGEDEGSVVT